LHFVVAFLTPPPVVLFVFRTLVVFFASSSSLSESSLSESSECASAVNEDEDEDEDEDNLNSIEVPHWEHSFERLTSNLKKVAIQKRHSSFLQHGVGVWLNDTALQMKQLISVDIFSIWVLEVEANTFIGLNNSVFF
jgi:hypothetical protein